MTIEAMKQWLEALEDLGMKHYENTGVVLYKDVFTDLCQAIADAEKQEPVAWMHPDGRIWTFGRGFDKSTFTIPLYTHPQPKRELVCVCGAVWEGDELVESPNTQSKREPPTPLEVKDVLRATGLLTNSQAWDVAEEVMKLLAAHGITSDMKQEHVAKTAKQRHKENT